MHCDEVKKKALIFNQNLHIRGGGERLCFEIASALETDGYQISFISTGENFVDPMQLAADFGIRPAQPWALFFVDSPGMVSEYCRSYGCDLFINNSFGSYLENPAPVGIYSTMFPRLVNDRERRALSTYTGIYCISHFTELYTARRWFSQNLQVIVPPISDVHLSQPAVAFEEKSKLLLCVGRFNVRGHSKCQLEAIQTFVEMQHDGILGDDWRLVVAGRVNEGEENLLYLNQCRNASNRNVTIYENIELSRLIKLYRQAAALWQFTGFGRDFGVDPECCEHLGLVALDSFAYGTLPMVYHRGGMPYVISHGVNGYCFSDRAELSEIMRSFALHLGGSFHRYQFEQSRRTAERFTFAHFAKEFTAMVRRLTPEDSEPTYATTTAGISA